MGHALDWVAEKGGIDSGRPGPRPAGAARIQNRSARFCRTGEFVHTP
jgi:hypothetical protein